MTRKRPPLPVIIATDVDGVGTIGSVDDLRTQKDEHDAKTVPLPAVKAGQKLGTFEILVQLAAAKCRRELFHPDDPHARIPAALIDIIARRISKRSWAKLEAEANRQDTAQRGRAVLAEADKVRAECPHLKDNVSDVARIVEKRLKGRFRRRGKDGERVPIDLSFTTIRLLIAKHPIAK